MGPKAKKPVNKIRVLFILFCVAFPVLNFLVFYVYVNLSSFGMAFTDRTGAFSLNNFVRVFCEFTSPDGTLRLALCNTLLTFAIQLIMYPFQVLVSFFIYKKIPFAGIYRILFFLPSILAGVVVSMVFTRMVGPTGFIAELVQKIGNLDYVPELLSDSRFANITVFAHMVWLSFPGDLVIWGGTFSRIPEEVLESGKIDGTTWWTEFTRIIVPMVWPTISLQMVLKFCGIFGASGAVFLLTGGEYGTVTLSVWQYLELLHNSGSAYNSNAYNYLSAAGMVLTVVAGGISLSVRKLADKFFDEMEF